MTMPVLWPAHPAIVPQWTTRGLIRAVVAGPHGSSRESFARAFSAVIGRKGQATGSGRLALQLALRAHGVGPGDEVILPTFACAALVTATLRLRAVPRFADVDRSFLISPAAVKALLGPRTRAIVGIHNGGLRAPTAELRSIADRVGALLVEDCAQTSGLAVDDWWPGRDGHAAIYSFGIGKVFMATAGGFLTGVGSEDAEHLPSEPLRRGYARLLAAIATLRLARFTRPFVIGLRLRGQYRPEDLPDAYPEVQISGVDAALLLGHMGSLRRIQAARRANGRMLAAELSANDGITVPPSEANDFAVFPITLSRATRTKEGGRAPELTALGRALLRAGFEPEGTYTPLHIRFRGLHPGADCPVAEQTYWRTMALPVRPGIGPAAIRRMAAVVRDFVVSADH